MWCSFMLLFVIGVIVIKLIILMNVKFVFCKKDSVFFLEKLCLFFLLEIFIWRKYFIGLVVCFLIFFVSDDWLSECK